MTELNSLLKDLKNTLNEIEKNETSASKERSFEELSKKEQKEYNNYSKFLEMSAYEHDLFNQGVKYICGIDEVGRGPIAGPVVAAAVILPRDFYLPGLNDSKKLTAKKREQFYKEIISNAITYGIGVCTVNEIDHDNIYNATKVAMERAIKQLTIVPDHLLIDAMTLPIDHKQTSIIKGDAKSISIAAASIIAKVSRDQYMKKLSLRYPEYGFETNSGYGTKKHIDALNQHGITPIHRKSFEPVKTLLMPKLV
ncbi:ribonuclease HII [Haloplasma contractile]|nr:ribonuclease HII [Haloplasma contractile]